MYSTISIFLLFAKNEKEKKKGSVKFELRGILSVTWDFKQLPSKWAVAAHSLLDHTSVKHCPVFAQREVALPYPQLLAPAFLPPFPMWMIWPLIWLKWHIFALPQPCLAQGFINACSIRKQRARRKQPCTNRQERIALLRGLTAWVACEINMSKYRFRGLTLKHPPGKFFPTFW